MLSFQAWGTKMERETRAVATHSLVTGLCWLLISACIFYLPYHFPPHRDDQSVSTLTGFNNSLAVAALLAGVVILSAAAWWKKADLPLEADGQRAQVMGVWPLVIVCVIQTLITVVLLIATAGRPPAGEAQYMLGRTYPLASGMVPYRDYDFFYGPLMLYLPYGISRLFSAPIDSVYILLFLGLQLLGLYLLWHIVRASTAAPHRQTLVFYALAAPTLPNLSLGLQYTFPRYLLAFAGLLVAARFTRLWAGRPAWLLVIYMPLCAVVFGLSPEVGLALIPALLAVLIAQARFYRERIVRPVLALSISLAALAILAPPGLLGGVRSFSKGGASFPVVPATFILLYVFSVLWVGPRLVIALWRWREANRSALPYAPDVTCGFLVLSLAMVPGALNRADGGHIFFYGIGFFLLMLLGAGVSGFAYRFYVGLFLVVFGVLLPYTGYYVYYKYLRLPVRISNRMPKLAAGVLRKLAGERRWQAWREADRWESVDLEELDRELAGVGPLCVPFGDSAAVMLLARRGAFQPDHFLGLAGVYTQDDVRMKIAGLRGCRGLILQGEMENPNSASIDTRISEIRSFFANLFLYPFPLTIDRRRLAEDVGDLVRAHCLQRYQLSVRLASGFSIYLPKGIP
jgi:hypothetical protein